MKRSSRRPKITLALAPAVLVLAWCGSAPAQDSGRSRPTLEAPLRDHRAEESRPKSLRIGAIGGLGFPQPLAIEGMGVMDGIFAVGAEFGALPSTSIAGAQTSLWALAGDLRLFPFRGAFFFGLRAGRQHMGASTTVTVPSIGSATEELALDSWFINPRLGFLWISSAGLAFGMDAGAQIPLSSSVSSTLPLSLVPSVQQVADTLGNSAIPTVDLLRLGLLL
jgi:hypothetical protein